MLARFRFWGIALVLIAAAALRLWGVRWGLPDSTHLFSYHPDEFHSLRGVLSLATGDLNPHFFNYGSLYLYVVSALCAIAHSSLVFGLDIGALPEAIRVFTLDARIVSAAAGVTTVYVVYLIGRRLASERTGLVAAAALAVMPLHVLNCHYGTVDVTQTLFIALCLYFTLGIIEGEGIRAWALAGAMAGLAASTKYNGILVLIAPVAAGALRPRPYPARCAGAPPDTRLRRGPGGERQTANGDEDGGRDGPRFHLRRVILGALACFGAALIAFAVTSPYTLLAWAEAKKDIIFELAHMRNGEADALAVWPNGWLFHLYISAALLPVAVALAGPVARRRLAPVLAFGLVWYPMISMARVRYARYGLPLDMLGALALGALCAGDWPVKLRRLQPLAWTTVGLMVLTWGAISAQRDLELGGPTTQDSMLAAILASVPTDRSVGMISEPWFDMPPLDYCNGGEALRKNPIWSRFRRPLREIVVTGMDAQRVRDLHPWAFVLSDVGFFYRRDAGDAGVEEVWRAITSEQPLEDLHRERRSWLGDSLFQRPLASDSRYACPDLRLYAPSLKLGDATGTSR
jgi:hypothetical protein